MKKQDLEKMRHSCSHVLAAAVKSLYGPHVKLAIGPAIENGFYYDFDFPKDIKISEVDFPKIEKEMKRIIKMGQPFVKHEEPVSAALASEKKLGEPYKVELIEDLKKTGAQKVSFYSIGELGPGSIFDDLCIGPHVASTGKIGPFKLLSLAGAYWRGSEVNPMLTRIYGTCFPTQKELDQYLWQLEEAKKRDHRKIGRELDLFSFHEEGPGFVFWHPKGMLLRETLMNLYNELHKKAGYQLISTPILLSEDLWHRSGHWDNYRDKMYFTKIDKKTFVIKPMNCPGVSLIYKNRLHSYKEFPLRLAELGEVHRHEPSGTLHGLFRTRAFRQDDAHIFVREDQVEAEIKGIIELTLKFYKLLGFPQVSIELSTRPEKSIGSDKLWEKAERSLKNILDDLNLKFKLNEGGGAFYGPKIDFHLRDSLLRTWQCGTIQLDFLMPERFGLEYIDKDGLPKRPVIIHRTVIGSIQRFTGILIEHFGGAFPLWLAPVQVVIIPISERHLDYSQEVHQGLVDQNIRTEIDERNETMQAKIREATLQKIPYMVIVGDKEIEESEKKKEKFISEGKNERSEFISIRTRKGENLGQMTLTKFLKNVLEEIRSKSSTV